MSNLTRLYHKDNKLRFSVPLLEYKNVDPTTDRITCRYIFNDHFTDVFYSDRSGRHHLIKSEDGLYFLTRDMIEKLCPYSGYLGDDILFLRHDSEREENEEIKKLENTVKDLSLELQELKKIKDTLCKNGNVAY